MTITGITIIIIIGLLFLLAELFLIPGSIKFGVVGVIFMVFAIMLTYYYHGAETGNWILGATMVFSVIATVLSIRFISKRDIGLMDVVDDKVNVIDQLEIMIGDEGVAFGDLKPYGKAIINDKEFDVQSQGDFIEDDSVIEVIKVTSNSIFVKKA